MTKRESKISKIPNLEIVSFYAPPNNYFDKIQVGFVNIGKNQRVVGEIFAEINSNSVAENNKKLFEILNKLKKDLKIKSFEYYKATQKVDEDTYECKIEGKFLVGIAQNNRKLKIYASFLDLEIQQKWFNYKKTP